MRLFPIVAAGCIALAAVPAPKALAQPQAVPPESGAELFDGVSYRLILRDDPSPLRAHVLELDLEHVALETTPGDRSGGREYLARTTSAYLSEFGLQAAVNGGYFTPFRGGSPGGDDYYPRGGDPVDVSGAAISSEVEASPVEPHEDERVNAILCVEGPQIEIRDGQVCAPGTDHALAGGPRLLRDGALSGFDGFGADYAAARHPRTALGLSLADRRAWLVVVDGRQPGLSEGATLEELAVLFLELGASEALNLDGGGSSAMVVAGPEGPQVLNSPIHTRVPGRERPSANHLGVRAAPLSREDAGQ